MYCKDGGLLTDVITLMIDMIFNQFDSWDLLLKAIQDELTALEVQIHQLQKAWLFCTVTTFSLELI